MPQRTKVLLIAGMGRSGSTLVAELLGQMKAFESIGEASVLWNRGLLKRNRSMLMSVPAVRDVFENELGGSGSA